VTLRIGFSDPNQAASTKTIFGSIGASLLKNAQQPDKYTVFLRYLVIGVITSLAFIIGLFAFTRSITKGIEAIGRNPLAKRTIQISILIQVVLTLLVTFGAIALSFIILRA
jgi:hypothetical protein